MVVFPSAKINLGLYVTDKRADGYHNIASIFYPIAYKDALEVIAGGCAEGKDFQFTQSGLPVAGQETDNLCVKAYQLLKRDFPELPAVQIHLHKLIPMGAGLGGGSSDAAAMLELLKQKFSLTIAHEQLSAYALALGSDCPFFLHKGPALASGRGELLSPVQVALDGYKILVVHPGIHVSTAAAFAAIQPKPITVSLRALIGEPHNEWRELLVNDFEAPVFAQHPEIAALKAGMYQAGASYASMSGSGSAVYGIFPASTSYQPKFPVGYSWKWV